MEAQAINNTPQTTGQRPGGFRHHRGGRGRAPARARPQGQPQIHPVGPPASGGGNVIERGKLKIMVLGGCEEVGRNCTLLEYEDDIIMIDAGLQFPEEDMPGIDYIIPNINYLRGKERRVRGIIITHGHYDHIGGIPYIAPRLGNPPIFGLPLTLGIIKRRQEDFEHTKVNLKEVALNDKLVLGKFQIEFFHINHSIPDAVGISVTTPAGTVIHTGDWKFDYTPVGTAPADFAKMVKIGERGVLALMGDSTNAGKPGHQVSEREIGLTLHTILANARGRVIIGTFASLLSRLRQIIDIAGELGKRVAVDGYSMKTNIEIARQLGYIKPKPGILIDIGDVNKYPKEKIVILCTGAQGEERAALMRMANNEHRFVNMTEGDTVIFSSSIIPGNERTIQRLKDTLYRKGVEVIHYQMMDVHAGGHAQNEDIKLMLLLFKPKYYIPIEGNHFLLRENAKVAYLMGWPKERVFIPDNGQVMEFARGEGRLTDKKVPTDYVFVDGLGVGDVSEVVLRDRQLLAADGMVIVIATVDKKTGALIGSPDIISRGFIFMKENLRVIDESRARLKKILIDRDPQSQADPEFIKKKIHEDLGAFLFQKTQRRPMILPVVIEV